jgi:hypothetical protein
MLLFLLSRLIALLNLLSRIPMWVGNGLGLVVLIAFVIGLIRGLPRWSLPHIGVIGLTLSWSLAHRGTVVGLNTRAGLLRPLLAWADRLFLRVMYASHGTVRAVLGAGWDWMVLLGLAAFGVLSVGALRPLRPLYARIREDWTLLSFGLYGSTVMAVSYTFEDYPSAKYPFMLASFVVLAAGAWAYVRPGQPAVERMPARRALALLAAMMLTMVLGAAGKGIIYASADGPYAHSATSQSVALHAVLVWGWVMVVVLGPVSLTVLPRPEGSPGVT